MKIGYFTTCFPYRYPKIGEKINLYVGGGVENAALNLAIQMEKLGHEIFIFTTSNEPENFVEKYGNISIFRYKKDFTVGQSPFSFQLLYNPLISGISLDIIHTHMGNQPAPIAAALYAKKTKKPFVVTYHGDYVGNFGGIGRRIGVLLQNHYFCNYILSSANKIIGLSNEHIKQSKYLQKHMSSIDIIPNGVNTHDFELNYSKNECREVLDLPKDRQIILFVGSLNSNKAPDVLLKAMLKIIKHAPNSFLVIVGDGVMRPELENYSKKSNLEGSVKFVGYISTNKEMYYKASDLFVLPSLSECFGIVNLEAMASGLPIVASKVGGIPDVVKDGINGLLVTPGDPEDLAKNILCLLNSESLREKLGTAGKILSKEYSWEMVANKIERVYLDLI